METRICILYFIRETEAARLYAKLPSSRNPTPTKDEQVWISKSQIEHTSKHALQDGEQWARHEVKLPEWLADTKNL